MSIVEGRAYSVSETAVVVAAMVAKTTFGNMTKGGLFLYSTRN